MAEQKKAKSPAEEKIYECGLCGSDHGCNCHNSIRSSREIDERYWPK